MTKIGGSRAMVSKTGGKPSFSDLEASSVGSGASASKDGEAKVEKCFAGSAFIAPRPTCIKGDVT